MDLYSIRDRRHLILIYYIDTIRRRSLISSMSSSSKSIKKLKDIENRNVQKLRFKYKKKFHFSKNRGKKKQKKNADFHSKI